MRLSKKMRFGLLLGALLLCATGCGEVSADSIMQKFSAKKADMSNCEATMELDLDMQDGSGEDYSMYMKSDMRMMSKPEYRAMLATQMDMGEMGAYDMDSYLVKEDGTYYTYMYASEMWMKQALSDEQIEEEIEIYKDQMEFDSYMDHLQKVAFIGEEDVDGKKTYKLEAVISGEGLEDVLDASEVTDYFGADLDSLDLNQLGSLKVSFWIDKDTYYPVQISMDMTKLLEAVIAQNGLDMIVSKCTLELQYHGFGTVEEILLPDAAKNAYLLEEVEE